MSSKIHYYPVETFKSLLIFDETEEIITNFSQMLSKEKAALSSASNQTPSNLPISPKNTGRSSNFVSATVFEITFNLHRSIIELANLDSKRETRLRLCDIEAIKVYDEYLIALEMADKVNLYFIPKKQSELKIIVEKISEYCKVFLGYEIILEFLQYANLKKFIQSLKQRFLATQMFSDAYTTCTKKEFA